MNVEISNSWSEVLKGEIDKEYFKLLSQFVDEEYANHTVYPPEGLVFNAFEKCPFEDVKVVIIGQDPYHQPYQANGLSFSVNEGVRLPPSLHNIYKEIYRDLGVEITASGDLERWSRQGVLLLNSILTVRADKAGSHQKQGWEKFTDFAVEKLASERENLVFMLWGSYAQQKGRNIDSSRHLVLTSAHPSPLAAYRGFLGNGHFSKANSYLKLNGKEPINW